MTMDSDLLEGLPLNFAQWTIVIAVLFRNTSLQVQLVDKH